MRILLVEVHLNPGMRDKFLEVIQDDATHSENDEPGCLRFDVLQDTEDADCFFYYEVYKDEAAVAAHRETPHYARYFEAQKTLIDSSRTTRHLVTNAVPNDASWR